MKLYNALIIICVIFIFLSINYIFTETHERTHKQHCISYGGKSVITEVGIFSGYHKCDINGLSKENIRDLKLVTAQVETTYDHRIFLNILTMILIFLILKESK